MSILTRFDDDDDDDDKTHRYNNNGNEHKKNFYKYLCGRKCVHVTMQCDVQAATTKTTTTVWDRLE